MAVNVKMGTVTAGTCRIQVRFVLSVVVMFSIAIVIMEAYYMIGSSTVDLTNVQEVITPPNDASTDGHKQRIIEDVLGSSTFIRDTTVTVDLNNVQEVITPPNDVSTDGHKQRIIEDVLGSSTFIRDTTVTVDLNNVQEVITPPNDASNDGHKPRQRMILMA